MLLGLIYLIKVESNRDQWSSRVPAGVLLIANVTFALFSILTAVATRVSHRKFWIGCSVVAVALSLAQIFELQPTGIAGNAALFLESTLMPNNADRGRIFRETHLSQLSQIISYGWTPLLSLLGGWYTHRLSLINSSDE